MADGDSKTSKLLTNHEPVSFFFVHFKLVLRAGLENLWLEKGREGKGRRKVLRNRPNSMFTNFKRFRSR